MGVSIHVKIFYCLKNYDMEEVGMSLLPSENKSENLS